MSHQQPAQTTNNNVSTRKKRRGMIEKRRRDKINNSLSELRRLVPAAFEKQGSAKLEKAEILQMTVDYLKMLHARGLADKLTEAPTPLGSSTPSKLIMGSQQHNLSQPNHHNGQQAYQNHHHQHHHHNHHQLPPQHQLHQALESPQLQQLQQLQPSTAAVHVSQNSSAEARPPSAANSTKLELSTSASASPTGSLNGQAATQVVVAASAAAHHHQHHLYNQHPFYNQHQLYNQHHQHLANVHHNHHHAHHQMTSAGSPGEHAVAAGVTTAFYY